MAEVFVKARVSRRCNSCKIIKFCFLFVFDLAASLNSPNKFCLKNALQIKSPNSFKASFYVFPSLANKKIEVDEQPPRADLDIKIDVWRKF